MTFNKAKLEELHHCLQDIVKLYEEEEILKRHRSYEYWKGYLAGIEAILEECFS